ncbi:MAG: ABC transporter substrate-binding protein [Deltaproteobacteria bacterium]|nr:ABC transporter substrate-binding protein [Deltaproteobacteria bacterium]
MRRQGWLILVLAGLGLAGEAWAQSGRMPVAYSAVSGAFAPLWVAYEEGLFTKHGLQVTQSFIAGGSRVAQTLVARDVELAVMGGGAIEATLGGGDLLYVAGYVNTLVFSLYARPEVRRVEDLRGKVVGATRHGTATMYSAILVLRKFGLEPGREVRLLQTGGVPETLAAMQAGTVHAGVVSAPTTLRARAMGFRELVDIAAVGIPFVHEGVVTTRAYLAAQPKRAEAFLKGFVEGLRLYKANRDLAEKVISKYTRVRDPELLRETYETFARHFLLKPYVPREAIANMLQVIADQNPRARQARPEEFYDNRMLQGLEAAGFFGPSGS